MIKIKMSKSQVREILEEREKMALRKTGYKCINTKYKWHRIAEDFLKDYSLFKDIFEGIEEDTIFTFISTSCLSKYKNDNSIILFDSRYIVLVELDGRLFIYLKPKYLLQ